MNGRMKRTQRDYSYPFKLSVVDQIKRGEMSVSQASRETPEERFSIAAKCYKMRDAGTFSRFNGLWSNMKTIRKNG